MKLHREDPEESEIWDASSLYVHNCDMYWVMEESEITRTKFRCRLHKTAI